MASRGLIEVGFRVHGQQDVTVIAGEIKGSEEALSNQPGEWPASPYPDTIMKGWAGRPGASQSASRPASQLCARAVV